MKLVLSLMICAIAIWPAYVRAKEDFQMQQQECRNGGAKYEVVIEDSRAKIVLRKKGEAYCNKPCTVLWKDFKDTPHISTIQCFTTTDHRTFTEPFLDGKTWMDQEKDPKTSSVPVNSVASLSLTEYLLTGSQQALMDFEKNSADQGFNSVEGMSKYTINTEELIRRIAEGPVSQGAAGSDDLRLYTTGSEKSVLEPQVRSGGFSEHPKGDAESLYSETSFSESLAAPVTSGPVSSWLQQRADALWDYAVEREKTPWMYSLGQPVEDPLAWGARFGAAIAEGWAYLFQKIGY